MSSRQGSTGSLTNDPVDVRPFYRPLQNERNRTNLPWPSSRPSYFIFRTPSISLSSPFACLRIPVNIRVSRNSPSEINFWSKPKARQLLRDVQWKRIFASKTEVYRVDRPDNDAPYFYFHRIARCQFHGFVCCCWFIVSILKIYISIFALLSEWKNAKAMAF